MSADLSARHLRFGWVALLVFAGLGLVLETLHGFKVAAYLDVSSETRRLMWRLAHAHGTLLALVNIVLWAHPRGFRENHFATTSPGCPSPSADRARRF